MLLPNHPTDANERLALAFAHLQQAFSLMYSVAPGIFDRSPRTAFTPLAPQFQGLDFGVARAGNGQHRTSIIDEDTFSVRWADRTCCLGNTVSFRLLARLARRPNQFVAYEVLFKDVWDDGYTSPEAVRSAVKVLRRKLAAAGMQDLADAIDGSTSRHYALKLAAP